MPIEPRSDTLQMVRATIGIARLNLLFLLDRHIPLDELVPTATDYSDDLLAVCFLLLFLFLYCLLQESLFGNSGREVLEVGAQGLVKFRVK